MAFHLDSTSALRLEPIGMLVALPRPPAKLDTAWKMQRLLAVVGMSYAKKIVILILAFVCDLYERLIIEKTS